MCSRPTVELVCRVNPTALAALTSKCTAAVTLLGFSSIKLLAAALSGKPTTWRHKSHVKVSKVPVCCKSTSHSLYVEEITGVIINYRQIEGPWEVKVEQVVGKVGIFDCQLVMLFRNGYVFC